MASITSDVAGGLMPEFSEWAAKIQRENRKGKKQDKGLRYRTKVFFTFYDMQDRYLH